MKPCRAPRTRWTKDEVTRRIERRARLGLDLSHAGVVRSEPALAAAVTRIMRRPWSVVIQDLGYRGRQIAWTDDLLRREIVRAHRFERASLPGVSRNAVYQAARERFGSWGKALQAVGLNPTLPLPQRWTKERVLRRIRERARRGESLSWQVVFKAEKGLYRAVRRFFGKPWTSLMRELGHDGGASRFYWTDDRVVKEMRRLRRGRPLSPGVTVKKLQQAAWHHFGSWSNAQVAHA